ncbi:hypothetical protein [Prosthecochloris sp. CIB 2401]|uniref:hypothetical protein n=1 Tax=Prosthecochloris sp. CIB 2401 TaxID=1868325 RepID=UPI00080AAB1C|nr:hypothetical protein [Prosthecochloris sp. CIB 2401]ANT64294.1 hypothetical protein Ptc2401_00495 [Prosthecochloris sp. CIB 2401]
MSVSSVELKKIPYNRFDEAAAKEVMYYIRLKPGLPGSVPAASTMKSQEQQPGLLFLYERLAAVMISR